MSFSVAEIVATANIETTECLTVFPNPATDILYLKNAPDLKTIDIFDLAGKLVFSTNNPTEAINIQSLQTGSYIIRASERATHKQFIGKFVKVE